MMVAQVPTGNKEQKLSRRQRRGKERRYQKAARRLEKLAAKTGLPVTFDNATVTAYGNFGLFERSQVKEAYERD